MTMALLLSLLAATTAGHSAGEVFATAPSAEAADIASAYVANALFAPGAYLLDAHPHYKHPMTGDIEDSGQNPGIGQGMTESVLGKKALLEAYDDGSLYVSVRFSLMDNIKNIKLSVQDGADSEFVPIDFETVKESMEEAVSDIRFQVPNEKVIVRANFFVTAMGRDVIFYMNFSNPVAGNGDFVTSPEKAPGDKSATGRAVGGDDGGVSQDSGSVTTTEGSTQKDAKSSGGGLPIPVFVALCAAIVVAALLIYTILRRRSAKGKAVNK
jgi:hypothetical protein